MNFNHLVRTVAAVLIASASAFALPVQAQDIAADALINRVSTEVLTTIQGDPSFRSSDISRIIDLVDSKLMPHINFKRMTAAAIGPTWRQIGPEQQNRLQQEFKILLIRTYSGALAQADKLTFVVRPMRNAPDDKEVVVRTEVRGHGNPIQIEYRMERTPGEGSGWKIYNLNIMGVWLVETYRGQFTQEINSKGVDGLITSLTERNRANASKG
jgi:phospholipid transport system substrate-binding protein